MILSGVNKSNQFRDISSKNKRVERLSFLLYGFRRMTSKFYFFQIFSFVKFFSVSRFGTGSHFQMTNRGDVKFSNELRFSWSCDSTSCAGRQILKQLELQTFVKFLYINIFPFYYNTIYFKNQIFIALQTLPRSRKFESSL